jgi:glycosyltransferase involved in cell wall biosynthesis
MIIAVNTISPGKNSTEIHGNFIYEAFVRIVKQHPQNTFIFIFGRPYHTLTLSENIIPVVIGPPAHPWLWKFWYNYKIPAVLKKYKADVFVSGDGIYSLRTKIPQCLVITDLAFLHYPGLLKNHARFYKKNTRKFLQKAAVIVTVSEFCKKDILTHYDVDENKIHVAFSGVDEIFNPANVGEREKIKEQYAGGNEYFLISGENYLRQNVLNLLKAFSVFKKRLKSNMKLLIVVKGAEKQDAFTKDLRLFKYKNDVHQLGSISAIEIARITTAAYAMVYPVYFDCCGIPLLESMRSGVPIITSNLSALREIGGDAALYFDPHDYADIAGKMMLMFKDERLRNELIVKGNQQGKKYNWQTTAELLWASIVRTTA